MIKTRIFRASSEESAETIQNLKEELSRRESEISNLNRKVEQLVKDLNEKTGNASEAYAKLNEIHQVRRDIVKLNF
jgi:flagellar biosynthesis chaperone FliJ